MTGDVASGTDAPPGSASTEVANFCMEWWLSVYRTVYRSCESKAEAEDLTQEVFSRALASTTPAKGLPSGPYLIQSARNLVIDRWRADQRKPPFEPLDENWASIQPGPEALNEAQEQRQAILEAIDTLPDTYSEVLRLRLQEGKSADLVGALLGMSANAVRQTQFRAIRALQKQLGHLKEEDT